MAREIRFQRLWLVIPIQNAIFPNQQIGVLVCEFLPVSGCAQRHPFANEEQICIGDGLVVQLRFAHAGRELLKRTQNLSSAVSRGYSLKYANARRTWSA